MLNNKNHFFIIFAIMIVLTSFFIFSCNSQENNENPSAPPSFEWQLIGPGGGGQITSITEDPSTPDNLYITINVGGARKSSDGGKTWKIINRGFDYKTLGQNAQKMMDIAVHPADSNILLCAGLNGDIYESSNGGEEWTLSFRHPARREYDFSGFVFDPQNPDTVYISVGSIQKLILGVAAKRTGGYWPKIDAGPSIIRGLRNGKKWEWNEVGSIEGDGRGGGRFLNIYSVGINPSDTKELFFVTERGVYKGTVQEDGRIKSFEAVREGLPDSRDIHGGKIVFNNGIPGIACLTILNMDNKKDAGGLYRSSDYGKSWTKLTGGLDEGSNYFDIQIDPKDSNTLYTGQTFIKVDSKWINGNLYRSRNGGENWEKLVKKDSSNLDAGWQTQDIRDREKSGVHFINISRHSDTLRWNMGGILFEGKDLNSGYPQWNNILTEKVGDSEWTTAGSEAIALAHSIGIDQKNSDILYIPYGDHNYFMSANGGKSLKIFLDSKEMKEAGNRYDSGTFIVDELDGKRLYVATQGPHQQLQDGGVIYSKDGGQSWETAGGHLRKDTRGLPRGAMTDLLVEYGKDKRNLYVANYGKSKENLETPGGVYFLEDVDGKNSWKLIFSMNGTYKLAADHNFNTLYAGVNREEGREGGLYKLKRTDGLWEEALYVKGFEDVTEINDMERGRESQNTYIASDKGLLVLDKYDMVTEIKVPQFEKLKSEGISPDVMAVEISPLNEDIIYIASPRTEILKSKDRGVNWTEISNNIPALGFIVLKADPLKDIIYAESPGGGIWKRVFSL